MKNTKKLIYKELTTDAIIAMLPEMELQAMPLLLKKTPFLRLDKKIVKAITEILEKKGFKKIIKGYYVNTDGKVFNCFTGKYMSLNCRNSFKADGKLYSVPKYMLKIFAHLPVRHTSQIAYKDGDRNNLNINNIDYCHIITGKIPPINYSDFALCLRCYFELPVNFNIRDSCMVNPLLQAIIDHRMLFSKMKAEEFTYYESLPIFKSYLFGFASRPDLAKKHQISLHDFSIIINNYIIYIINDIIKDYEKGYLQEKKMVIPKTETEKSKDKKALKSWQKFRDDLLNENTNTK